MIIGDMEIRLRADIARLQRDMDAARQVVGNATAGMERAANAAKAAFAGIAAALGGQQLIAMADQYTKFTAQLKLATESQREYAAAYADVKRIATTAQAELGATGVLYARIANGTRELGVTQKEVAKITETVNLALKVSGATFEESHSAMLQLSQAFASGTLRGEEFNAVNEAAPRLMKALADGIGVPVGALKKMAEEGQITSRIMSDVLPNALDDLQEEAKEVQTIAGAFTLLKNNTMEFVGVQAQANGVVAAMTGGLELLAKNLTLVGIGVLTVTGAKLANWLDVAASKAMQKVAADRALIASNLAVAQAEATATAQSSLLANARVAEVRAATLAASGNTMLALTMNGLNPAIGRATTAAALHDAAMVRLAVAQRAAAVSTRALGAALAATGGPLGLLITVLGAAAIAWSWYKQKQDEATTDAAQNVQKSTGEIIASLDKENEKLRERIELAKKAGMAPVAQQGGEAADRLAEISALLDAEKALVAAGKGDQLQVINLSAIYDELAASIKRTSGAKTELANINTGTSMSDWLAKNTQYLSEAERIQAALKKARDELKVDVLPADIEKRIRASFGKEAAKEIENATKAAKEFIGSLEQERQAIGATEQQQRMMTAARAAAKAPTAELRMQIMQTAVAVDRELQAWAASEESKKQAIEFEKNYAEAVGMTGRLLADRVKDVEAEATRNEELADTYGMTKVAIEQLELARLGEQLAQRATLGLTLDEIEALEKLIAAKTRNAAALMSMEEAEALKKAAEDQKRLWGDIERTAHDTFISIFDSGKSAFDRLKDALKNGLYELLYQMTVKKWIINLQASSTGGSLAQAITSSGSGGSSIFGTASNLFEVGKSIFGGFKTGLSSYLGQGVSYVGNAVGSNAMFSFGQGMQGFGAGGIGSGISGGAASAGSSFASALPIAGWIAAGMMANNKFYDQGWRMDGQSSDIIKSQFDSMWKGNGLAPLTTIMTASMGTFDKLLTSLGLDGKTASMLSGSALWTRAFGRKAPSVEAQGIQGTVSSSGFDGQAYAEMLEKGGWFRSDKRYTQTAALGADQDKSLDATVKAMIDAAKGFASTLGIEAGVIDGYNKQIKLQLGSDEAKNQEAIAKLFGEIGDELSLRLVPNLSSFAQAGEATSATLQRLVTDYATVDEALTAIGMQFGAVGVQSLSARERLVEAAGGLEAFAANTAGFQQNFLTEAERNAPVLKAVTEQLAAMGLAGVDTRDEFKQVVLGLDLTTEAGAKQYGELMKMQAAFAQVHPAIDAAAIAAEREAKVLQERAGLQDRLDALTLTSAQLREKEIAKYAESNQALLRQIFALEDQKAALQASADAINAVKEAAATLLGDVDGALSAVQSVVAREKEAVQSSIDAHSASVSKLQSLSQALRGTLDSIKSPDQQLAARAVGQAQISAALAIARAGGPLPGADSLKDALAAVKQDAAGQFSNYTDYLRDLYKTQNDIGALADLTDVSLSVEEKALKAAQEQVKSLDDMLKAAQSQVDLLKGINTNGLNMIQAMEALRGAILAAQANPVAAATPAINSAYQTYLGRAPEAGGKEFWQNRAAEGVPIDVITDAIKNSPEAQLQNVYKDLLGRTADAGGLSFYLNSGLSIPDIAAAIKTSDEYKAKIPGFANGGDFAGGVRLVGEVGPEIEVTGASRIHSTRSLMDALRNPTDNSEVLAKAVDRLTATVERQQGMIEQQGAALTQIQRNTLRSANTLDMVSDGGNAVRTKGATTQ
jgi:tape measure domain-containing protein